MAGADAQSELSAFRLEVARMFFALPSARASCWPGERPCSHSTLLHGPPMTSTSSPSVRQGYAARPHQADRRGLRHQVLAGMIATLDRFTDSEIPVPDGTSAAELRAFYAAWRSELTA